MSLREQVMPNVGVSLFQTRLTRDLHSAFYRRLRAYLLQIERESEHERMQNLVRSVGFGE